MKTRPPSLLNIQRKGTSIAWNLLPVAVTWLHVLVSPYTKVEESFTLHVVHDVLVHGWDWGKWDHVTFPGAVPRSFLPGLVLGGLAWGPVYAARTLGLLRNKVDVQIVGKSRFPPLPPRFSSGGKTEYADSSVRLVLASIHAFAFAQLSKSIRFRYGSLPRVFFALLSLTQFHIPYYAGRTLPNFTALPGVLLAFAWIIRSGAGTLPAPIRRKRVRMAIGLITALATNTRLELAALLGPMVGCMVISGMVRVGDAVLSGAVGGFGALLLAGPIDYLLWSLALPHPSLPTFNAPWQTIWPELSAMAYNLLAGQSANWGIMPAHYYLSNSLPKLLMGSLPLALLAVVWTGVQSLGMGPLRTYVRARPAEERAVREITLRMGLGVGAAAMLAGLSCVGHKEWRFVVYVVPVFNLLAAIAAASLWSSAPVRIRPLVRLGLVGVLALQIAATGSLTFISANNYPGGEVWQALDAVQANATRPVTVHFSSYPLQTGASLFTFTHDTSPFSSFPSSSAIIGAGWTYSKDEDAALLTPDGAARAGLDLVVLESGTERVWLEDGGWSIATTIQGLKGVGRGGKYGLTVGWAEKIVILERQSTSV